MTYKNASIQLTVLIMIFLGIFILPASGDDKTPEKIAATVNGVPIYEKDVQKGLPKYGFGSRLKYKREAKLDALIYTSILNQFMKLEKILIDDQRLDAHIEYIKKYPPESGCSCCRYESLEQFLLYNHYTIDDFRNETRVNMALEEYMTRLWDKKYPNKEKLAELVKKERIAVKDKYINVSHIFLNAFQDPQYEIMPDKVFHQKMAKAMIAYKELLSGEKFEILATKFSEDKITFETGGSLGLIRKNYFGREFSDAAKQLSPGQYSKPVKTVWGVHIIMRNKTTDADILNLLKTEYIETEQVDIINKLMDEAKVVRYDKDK